jgi:hypothetical protein
MNAWKTITIAGATLALAAPAANATFDRSLPTHAKGAKKISHHRLAPKGSSKSSGGYTINCIAEPLCLTDLGTPASTSDSLVTAPAQATYNDSAGT